MKVLLAAALFLTGCATECGIEGNRNVPESITEEAWVCHNPQSEHHGTLCTDECYWVGNLKVESSFCWLLQPSDCSGVYVYAWQRENCHLIEN